MMCTHRRFGPRCVVAIHQWTPQNMRRQLRTRPLVVQRYARPGSSVVRATPREEQGITARNEVALNINLQLDFYGIWLVTKWPLGGFPS
jgi:hypothetical protein